MNLNRLILLALRLFPLLLLLVVPSVFAGEPLGGDASGGAGSLGDIAIDDFNKMMQAMKVTGDGYSTIFINEGLDLAKVLALAVISFNLFLKMLTGGDPEHWNRQIVLTGFKLSVVFVMLVSWTDPSIPVPGGDPLGRTGGNWQVPYSVKNIFVDSFDELQAPIFDKAGMDKGTVVKVIGTTFSIFWQSSDERGKIRDAARARSAGKGLGAYLADTISINIEAIGDKVVSFVMIIVVGLISVALIVTYLFMIFFGDIMVVFGMALGPLMIPGLLLKRTEYLFDGWFKFIIGAGFFKLVAALTAVLTIGTINTIQFQVNDMYAKALADTDNVTNGVYMAWGFLLSLLMTIIFMLFGLFLMKAIPHITESLMRGQTTGAGGAIATAAKDTAGAAGKGK